MRNRLSQLPPFREAPRENGAREHRRKAGFTESLPHAVFLEKIQIPPETLDRPDIGSPHAFGHTDEEVRHDVEAHVSEAGGEGDGALAVADGDRKSTRLNSS